MFPCPSTKQMTCNESILLISCVVRGPVSYRACMLRWQGHHDTGIMATSHEFHHSQDFFSSSSHSLFHSSSFSTELAYLTHQDFLCCLLKICICFFLKKKL